MKRKFRLNKSSDFERVRRFGRSYAQQLVVLIILNNDRANVRVGVAASRTIGGAVQRNRAKRIIRAGIHPFINTISENIDILLIARKPIAEANSNTLAVEIKKLLTKAKLI